MLISINILILRLYCRCPLWLLLSSGVLFSSHNMLPCFQSQGEELYFSARSELYAMVQSCCEIFTIFVCIYYSTYNILSKQWLSIVMHIPCKFSVTKTYVWHEIRWISWIINKIAKQSFVILWAWVLLPLNMFSNANFALLFFF